MCIGVLVLALAFAIGNRLAGPLAGALATLLLVTWQWMPAESHTHAASGVLLVDLSRMARYDVLVALFTLAGLWFFARAQQRQRFADDFLCGACVGCAGLSHVYGLFWLPAFLIALWLDRSSGHRHRVATRAASLCVGTLVVILPWVAIVATNLEDYAGQMRISASRLDVLDPSFYLNNLLTEHTRYFIGVGSGAALGRIGFWLLLIGVPVAWVSLFIRSTRERQSLRRQFLLICIVVPFLFALLLQPKTFRYLPGIVGLFALLIAVALTSLCRARSRWLRFGAVATVIAIALSGVSGILVLQSKASRAEPARRFLVRLRQSVPTSARILGLPDYWLGLTDNEYRVFYLPFYYSMPVTADKPMRFDDALERIAPDIILVDEPMRRLFDDDSTPESRTRSERFWDYVGRHGGTRIGTIRDNHGQPIDIFQLKRPHP
jgi:hypothetical protein